jgi:hypothetical protein
MTKEKTNPNDSATGFAWSQEQQGTSGLTKREYFAAMALQGYITTECYSIYDCARHAVKSADALIATLNE